MPEFDINRKGRLLWRFAFEQDQIRMGRSEENDIVLSDRAISRLHVVVGKEGGRYVLRDQSTNGTLVNGKRVEWIALDDTAKIDIGPYSLLFRKDIRASGSEGRFGEEGSTIISSFEEKTDRFHVTQFWLELKVDGERRRVPVPAREGRILVGRSPDSDIRIDHPSVLDVHAVLEFRKGRFSLLGVNGKKGTHQGEKGTRKTSLRLDKDFRIGRVRVRLVSKARTVPLEPEGAAPVEGMVGTSLPMRRVYALIRRLADAQVPVLIQGETGTGKELVARALHTLGGRSRGPFVTVNAATFHANLVESELFGHEKGAFTGALERRIGAFERADGGTLFLDEIGELPLDLQPKLLRVLEDRTFARLGGNVQRVSAFRLISATNRKLEQVVLRGRFRQDLYYRIGVVPLSLPPLRERKEDIPLLVDHFQKRAAEGAGRTSALALSTRAREELMRHDWPGNVRELRNVVERAVLMTDQNVIDAEAVNFIPLGDVDVVGPLIDGKTSLEEVEREVIVRTLKVQNGNKRAAARVLGVAHSTLWAKMKKYAITDSEWE